MAQATWEKPLSGADVGFKSPSPNPAGRWKFIMGGVLILSSVVVLIFVSTFANIQSFTTIDEIVNNPQDYIGRTVRISGAVIGESIRYDDHNNLDFSFTISHIPTDFTNLAEALHQSVNDPTLSNLQIVVYNQVMPDLLTHEAQAIVTGTLGEDGIFYASELLLKCPSRFEDGGSRNNLSEDHPGMQFFSDAN
jgi:cytochrome c-type biogenesis protein CcmE